MTDEQVFLARRYLAYKFLSNLWFVGAVWLYFYRIFITDAQIGILDGMAFAIGLIAEIPSGALADKFGRDRLVKIGQILAGSGVLIQAFGSDFVPFFVGQTILMIGVSFTSGADEALFFEKMKFERSSPKWRKLVTKTSQMALIATLFATVSGGLLHNIDPRFPWILNGIAFIASALIILSIKDERTLKKRQKFFVEIKDYLLDIKKGMSEFRKPNLWIYVPIIITVQGLFYTVGYGLLRLVLLDRFNFTPFLGSIAIATSSLITIGLLALMHKNAEALSEKKVITYISLSAAASLVLSLADIGLWGYVVILTLYAGEHLLYPFMSETFNYHATEERRATVLSVASFLRSLPYVALGPIIGGLNVGGNLNYFLLIWALLILVAVLFYLGTKRRDTKINIEAQS